MLPSERQTCIREWIEKENAMKISDLSKRLGVSEMTIHRDVKPLIEEGLIEKTFGGITKREVTMASLRSNSCCYCNRPVRERIAYRIIMPDHVIHNTCCPHCGLLLHKRFEDSVLQALCHDFLTEATISAMLASFVFDANLNINCCQPQVLTFGTREDAERFTKGFGGTVLLFEEAIEEVNKRMDTSSNCCE